MSDQTVTLRITAEASGVGPAAKAAADQVGKIGQTAEQAAAKTTAATGKIVQGTQAVGAGAGAASTQLGRLGRSGSDAGEQVAAGARKGNEGLKQMVREAASAQTSVQSIVRSAAALAGAFVGGVGVKEFFSAFVQGADLQGRLEAQLQRVTQSQAEYNSVLGRTRQIADDAYVSVNSVSEIYVRSIEPMRQLGRTSKDTLDLTEALSLSLVVSSASADKQASAIDALGKVMQSGKADMNGFMTLVNTAPRFVEALEAALGKTRAELIEMVGAGQLTAASITAVSTQLGLLRDEVQAMPTELVDAGVRFRNEFQSWASATNQQLGITQALVAGLDTLSNNIGTLVSTITILAAAWSIKYVAGLVAARVAAAAKLTANVQLAASELALAQASEVAAAAQVKQAITLNGTSVATQALAAAQARTAAATNALSAAQAANTGLMARAGSGLLALAGGPLGVLALAVGAVAAVTYNAIQAEKARVQEFEDGIASTLAAAEATEQLIDSLTRVGGAQPPSLADRFTAEAEAIAKLTAEQDRLTAAREAFARAQMLDTSLLAGQRVEGMRPHIDAEFDRLQRLESATGRLAEQTLRLSRANSESLGPAIEAMTAKFRELEDAGNGSWLSQLESLGPRVAAALAAGRGELDSMNAAYRDADGIAATLTANAKKAGEELLNLGKSQAEVAIAQISTWEERVRASGALTEEQIAARKEELQASVSIVAALQREQEAIKGKAKAQRDSERIQREQVKAWNDSLRASNTFRERLADLRAEMGGPLKRAQLEHERALASIAQLAREAGIETEVLAEAQGLLTDKFNDNVTKIAKDAAAAVKDATKDIGRSWKDVINELEDTSLSRLLKEIDLVKKGLLSATDPATIERLTKALGVLQGELGQVEHSMHVAMIQTTQEGLRSLQSMTENGSKAFAAMQVAIDALSLAQAISAVLNQGQGDVYTAFARMAAMAAAVSQLVGSIGGSFGGSNGFTDTAAQRQASQGTGTVLGDAEAKSQSIQKSLDIIADATSQLPGLSRSMVRALQQLQSGIDSAGGMLARGADATEFAWPRDTELNQVGWGRFLSRLGDPIFGTGLLGRFLGGSSQITDQGLALGGGSLSNINLQAYEEQQYRSWRFGSRRTREQFGDVGADFEAQFQLIVDSLVETVRQGALALGVLPEEIEERLQSFVIEATRISLKDLSAEEKRAEILAVFSAIFDDLAGDVVPFISQFQRLGEGLGETLVRVATGVQVTREALDRLGFSLEAAGPEEFAQISESLIELAGGLEAFINGMSSFIDKFAPESKKFELLQSDLTRAFAEAGLVVPETREAMWELMQSLDATTESGREQIATLLRLSGTADAYFTMLERRDADQARALQDQLDALSDYVALVQALRDELNADTGMSAFAIEMRDIDRWAADARDALHDAARAAGMQAAAEEDLALVHQVAAQRAAVAIERLRASAADLVAQLYGTPLDQIEEEIRRIEAAQSASTNSQISSINEVGAAAQRVYEAQLAALQGIQAWLDSQQLGDLSTLTPAEKLAEAQRQFEATLLAAQAGDVDALQAITGQADALLRLGRDYFASSEPYGDLEAMVRGALQGLVTTGPLASPSDSTGGSSGGSYGGGSIVVSSELQALYEKRDELLNQQMVAQREAMLRELGGMVRELIAATRLPLEEVAEMIGLNLTKLAEDLGINLQELSVETALGLANMARQLGVDVAELAQNVGVELGSLGDRQSLLNQALDRTLETIPEQFRDQLRGPLDAIRDATTEADATAAVHAAEDAIRGMPAGIRDLLAPFFTGIDPQPVISELTTLRTLAATADAQLSELSLIREAIEAIGRNPGVVEGAGMPSYAVGTAFVPRTGPALIHAGEMIVPASVNAWAQRNGMTIGPAQGGNADAVIAELLALREQQERAAQEAARRLERLEQAQRDSANEISRELRRTGDLLQQRGR